MMGKVNRTRLIARGTESITRRDPNIFLVVVATEDTHAAKQYLDALQAAGLVDQGRLRVIPLPTVDGRSALGALLDRLEEYRKALDVSLAQDEYWVVFDVEHHKPKELSGGAQIAKSRGYRLAGSNPCFELWLLLHLTDNIAGIPSGTGDRRAARHCERQLHKALQAGDPKARGYDKTSIGAERFARLELVNAARSRARSLSPKRAAPWPFTVSTHVHFLIERLPPPLMPLAG